MLFNYLNNFQKPRPLLYYKLPKQKVKLRNNKTSKNRGFQNLNYSTLLYDEFEPFINGY